MIYWSDPDDRRPPDALIEVPIGTIDDDMTIRSVLGRPVGHLAQWNAAVYQRAYDWD